jgi:carboxymethylenebutenolidase
MSSPRATRDAGSGRKSELSGNISEEEFKKLHQLRADEAPPRRGVMIDLKAARAYLTLPTATPPVPGIIVIHEWWGLNDHIKHWADRLAADGYAALAVDLFGGVVATTPDAATSAVKAVDPKRATATLLDAHAFLLKDARIRAPSTAAIGWCFGGKWALNLGLAAPELDAVVAYYGHVTTDANELKALRAPLLGIFGNRDKSIPPAKVDEFERGLQQAGVRHTVLRYDADHAFANPSGPRYEANAADDAWRKARGFLAERLMQPR